MTRKEKKSKVVWWKVFIPTYISIAIVVVCLVVLAIFAAWENKKDKDRWS